MAIQLGSAYGKVNIDASGVKTGVNSAIGSMQALQTKMLAIGQTMSDIGGKMTLGLTLPLGLFAKSAIDSSNQAQDAMTNLKTTIESTGGVAGVTAEKAIEMATAFQKVTKFSDETIINGEAMLLTFTKIGKDIFPQATEAMLNMGEKFGSVENASIQLGKALNDPISGVTALRRVGVMLTDEQENQIKKFMEVNDIASAQKVILKELETEFGGLAIAMGKTDSGKIEQFKNALDDLKELFGDRLKKSLIPFLESVTKAINDFLALPEPVKNAIVDMVINIGKLAFVAGPIIFIIGKLLTFASLFLPGGALAGVGTFLTTTLLPAFSQFFTFITATAIPAIAAFAAANAWWIVPLLLVAATVYLVYLAFKNNFMGITTAAQQLWFIIKFYFGEGWKWLVTAVKGGGTTIIDWFKRMTTQIVQSFKNIQWAQIGRNMISGLVNGLLGGLPAVAAAGARVGLAALEALRRAINARSPSKKFEEAGEDSGDGYANGLDASMKKTEPIIRRNVQSALKVQLDFFSNYFKNLEGMQAQNTKSHQSAMKAQALATQQSLQAQAEAMKKYQAAAAKFWSGRGIPMGAAMSNLSNSASSMSPYMEQMSNANFMEQIVQPGWTPSVQQEQARPVRVEVINQFGSGVTTRQATEMVNRGKDDIYNSLISALGGQ